MLSYRSAKPEDLPFIVGLIVEDSLVATSDSVAAASGPDYRAALTAIDADPHQEMILVEREGEPVGCFQLSYIPGLTRRGQWRGQIEVVHVAAVHRNQGIGSEMMRWAIARCREHRCELIQLRSNKKRQDAHRFYRRLGFELSHDGFKLQL